MRPRRLAGVVLPLSSIRTRRDYGIGQITDIPRAAAWIRSFGHSLLQILPPHQTAGDEISPYGACTAFALDTAYVGIESIPELGGESVPDVIGSAGVREVQELRKLRMTDLVRSRAIKTKLLDAAFEKFVVEHWRKGTERCALFEAFAETESSWLPTYAAYRVLTDVRGSGWRAFAEDERNDPALGVRRVRDLWPMRYLRVLYEQWLLLSQWDTARAEMRVLGVELMGDLPFVVGGESADVWANPSQFHLDLSLGAPPDGFTPEGQDWGLPPYNWEEMDKNDLAWLRARAAHAARLYDRFRLDHVVGLFRQWVRKPGQPGYFDPGEDAAQRARGAKVLSAIVHSAEGADVIAEDLGVIPDFVRATMKSLDLPGYRVIPWERDDGQLRDPQKFPETSVVTWSTHDTPPITAWWKSMNEREQGELLALADVPAGADEATRTLKLLNVVYRSPARLSLVLAQEVLGGDERINLPGSVGAHNWTYRLPRPLEELEVDPELQKRLARIREAVVSSERQ